MIQLSLPITVACASCAVPRLMEQYSRIVLRSPISTRVGSPAYFLSWFASPIEQKWKMRLSRPMRVWPVMRLCAPIVVPSPTSTSPSITVYGPTLTLAPSFARLSTVAVGWIALMDALQLPKGTDQLGLRDQGAGDGGDGVELRHAAAAASGSDLDAQLVAREHRALEARAVDADEVVHPFA